MAAERGEIDALKAGFNELQKTQADLFNKLGLYEKQQAEGKAELQKAIALEISKVTGVINDLHAQASNAATQTSTAVSVLEQRVQALERAHVQGSREKKTLLNLKDLKPRELTKDDEWRRWKSEVEDFTEETFPGMKAMLDKAKEADAEVDETWFEQAEEEWWQKADCLYRFLKRYTGTEARRIVTSVADENGWEAWRKLHQQYEPATVTREAQVLNRYTSMITRRAKTPRETKALMVELGERARRVEEVTGKAIEARHAMSVISGILDPETAKHTAQYQGVKSSVEVLKTKVMQFTNLMTQSDDKMDINKLQQQYQLPYCQEDQGEEEQEEEGGCLDALNTQCLRCGGYGHYARECATKQQAKGQGNKGSKGKGKATGKGKGKGKGNKKGPEAGCWTCGGAHYQSDCPQTAPSKGGGKGVKGEVKVLSAFREVATRNRFDVLMERDDDPGQVNDPGRADDSVQVNDPGHVKDPDYKSEPGHAKYPDRVIRVSEQNYRESGRQMSADDKVYLNNIPGTSHRTSTALQRRWGKSANGEQNNGVGKAMKQNLNLFREIERPGIRNLDEQVWEEIELAVDSGATETVVNEDMLTSVETTEGDAYKRGVEYEVASGQTIPNMGEKRFIAVSESGGVRAMTAQVCDVNKPLLSVRKVVQAGNRVIFEPKGGYIEDVESGERLNMKLQGGMYVLKMWARKPDHFQGQAQVAVKP